MFTKKHERTLTWLTFMCKKGGYILYIYFCDGYVDCPNDNSDEEDCKCNDKKELMSQRSCIIYKSKKVHVKCHFLYHITLDEYCDLYKKGVGSKNISLELQIDTKAKSTLPLRDGGFKCANNVIIHKCLVNDLIADCGPEAEDEPLLKSLLLNNSHESLCKSNELPCRDGHFKCYNFSNICVFALNHFHHLTPCRNGANLENCKVFQCNMMYKCHYSYCINWNYVCDGKWDCPQGDDEDNVNPICGSKDNCINMYKCKDYKLKCIDIGKICNQENDCPNGDDEMFCDLVNMFCPFNCQCLIYAIACNNINDRIYFKIFDPFIFVSISNSRLTTIDTYFQTAHFLKLPSNLIKEVCHVNSLKEVVYLDLAFNLIQHIKSGCFSDFVHLIIINLKNNEITKLSTASFLNLTSLKFLDMSNNPLSVIKSNSFANLRLLNFTEIEIGEIKSQAFDHMKKSFVIINTNYYLSCISPPHSICTRHPPWYVSCSGIVPGNLLTVLFWCVLLAILALNVLSIVIHALKIMANKIFLITVLSININDILFALYLLIILISKSSLHESVFLQGKWRSHLFCFLAFGTILWYTILSQVLLVFMSLGRLLVVLYPLSSKFRKSHFTLKCILAAYCSSFGISLLVTILFETLYIFVPIDFCMPFINPAKSIVLCDILTWTVVITQTISSVAISTMYTLLYKTYKRSEIITVSSNQNKAKIIFIQIFLVSTSNILCWFPSNVIYIVAATKVTYPIDLIIWTILTVLPINSLVNPLVLIIKFARKVKGHLNR